MAEAAAALWKSLPQSLNGKVVRIGMTVAHLHAFAPAFRRERRAPCQGRTLTSQNWCDLHGQAPLLWAASALLRPDCPGVR
jgi:hypothetical protein